MRVSDMDDARLKEVADRLSRAERDLKAIDPPAATSTARHKAPGMIMLPAARVWPNSASLLASHATGSAGWPSTAAPTPFSTAVPFFSSVMPTFARSHAAGEDFSAPSTTRADDALSAIVSASVIFQSRIRVSMISSAGVTYSAAAITSSRVTPGPRSSRDSTNAISGSTRGSISELTRHSPPLARTMSSNR